MHLFNKEFHVFVNFLLRYIPQIQSKLQIFVHHQNMSLSLKGKETKYSFWHRYAPFYT